MSRRVEMVLAAVVMLYGLAVAVPQLFVDRPWQLGVATGVVLFVLGAGWIVEARDRHAKLEKLRAARPYDWEGRDYFGPYEVVTDRRLVAPGRVVLHRPRGLR